MNEKLEKIIISIDTKREDIEDFIANDVLDKWDSYEKVDDVRIAVNKAVISLVLIELTANGIPVVLSDEQITKIAKSGAKIEKKLNAILQQQLIKKSKMYKKHVIAKKS